MRRHTNYSRRNKLSAEHRRSLSQQVIWSCLLAEGKGFFLGISRSRIHALFLAINTPANQSMLCLYMKPIYTERLMLHHLL